MNGKCVLCSGKKYQKLFAINRYKIVQCEKCTLIFTIPWPNKKDLERLYRNYDHAAGFFHESSIRKDARRTLHVLRQLGYAKGDLLDIGCGTGFLLDEMRKVGWNTLGIDTSPTLVAYARRKLGLQILQEDIHRFSSKKRFQAITLIQVLEHLPNPYPTLNKIESLLDDNGIVCIATPNITSILFRVLREKFNYLIPPEHVIYYSPRTLKQLLEKVGFRVIKKATYGYPEDIGAIYRFLRERQQNSNVQLANSEPTHNEKRSGNNSSIIKRFKGFLFEDVFRNLAYPILNIGLNGSMIEIYATKR